MRIFAWFRYLQKLVSVGAIRRFIFRFLQIKTLVDIERPSCCANGSLLENSSSASKYIPKSFRKFTKKHQWRSLMLVKLQAFTGAEQSPDAFYKKVFLERCSQNPQEKACIRDSILIKLYSKDFKKETWHKCFPVNLAKFLRTPPDDCSCF